MRKLFRIVFEILLVLILLSVAVVSMFRWIDPPFSAYMAQIRVQEALNGQWPSLIHRWVDYDAISPHMRLAAVAAEDQKFPTHHGFDLESIRQAIEDMREGGRLRGASTISQQVAKNLFLWPGRSLWRKAAEAYVTLIIELVWPKRRILEMYLNIAEMGPGLFGVAAASRHYFDTSPADLTRSEAALIAAALPSPHRYRIDAPSAYLQGRQRWVMEQMDSLGGPSYLIPIE